MSVLGYLLLFPSFAGADPARVPSSWSFDVLAGVGSMLWSCTDPDGCPSAVVPTGNADAAIVWWAHRNIGVGVRGHAVFWDRNGLATLALFGPDVSLRSAAGTEMHLTIGPSVIDVGAGTHWGIGAGLRASQVIAQWESLALVVSVDVAAARLGSDVAFPFAGMVGVTHR